MMVSEFRLTFENHIVLAQTIYLVTSSFIQTLKIVCIHRNSRNKWAKSDVLAFVKCYHQTLLHFCSRNATVCGLLHLFNNLVNEFILTNSLYILTKYFHTLKPIQFINYIFYIYKKLNIQYIFRMTIFKSSWFIVESFYHFQLFLLSISVMMMSFLYK